MTQQPPRLHAATWGHRYVLGPTVATGEASVTREAYDLVLSRDVLLEELDTAGADPTALLPAEVTALSSIDHPNVVRVYDVRAEGRPFVTTELLRGRTLDELLLGGPLPIARAVPILRQVAAGLDALHAAGLVHGDVRPANVIVGREGVAKIAGTGLVQLLARIRPGAVPSAAGYRAPERSSGRAGATTLEASSDVYAFGVTCFDVLMGRAPSVEVSTSRLVRATGTPPVAGVGAPIDERLDWPLAQALAKSPGDRPPSCTAIVDGFAFAATDAVAGPVRVVIADDDRDHRALVTSILDAYLPGLEVVVCAGGQCALDAVTARRTTIVLLDLEMPAPSGLDLVRLIRDQSPKTAIVIVTGKGSGTERAVARDLGVRRFLVKPFEVDELVGAVREATTDEPRRAG